MENTKSCTGEFYLLSDKDRNDVLSQRVEMRRNEQKLRNSAFSVAKPPVKYEQVPPKTESTMYKLFQAVCNIFEKQ